MKYGKALKRTRDMQKTMTKNNGLNKVNTKKLSDIANILNGYAFKSANYVENGIRVIRIANVQDGYIVDDAPCFYPVDTNEDIKKYNLFAGDLLISLTGNVGRIGILPADMLPAALNQRVCCLRIDETIVDRKYLFYYFRRHQFMRDCVKASKGVAQLNLSTKWLAEYEVPIPSIAVQKSIVAWIEELFSELDNGVETLRKTKQQLAVYRQAVLKDAFSTCRKQVAVASVCDHITDGDHMPPPKAPSGIPFIMISNVDGNQIDFSETAFVGRDYYENIDSKRRPQIGDVLYSVTGSFGIPVLVDFEKEFCFQRHIALLRPNDSILSRYLRYAMQAPDVYAQASKGATGTAQKTVGLTVLRKILIPYTESKLEQEEIVRDIENKMSVCDSIEKTVDTALQQAEAMRQSILKQAFEGRL